jgi:hypothetical protein
MRGAPAPGNGEVTCQVRAPGPNRPGAAAEQGFDDRGNGVAVRRQPGGKSVNGYGDQKRAEDRRADAEQQRSAERIVEVVNRDAAETAVEPLHCRYDAGASGHDAPGERPKFAQPARCNAHARTVDGTDLAAEPQAARQ